MTDLPKLRDGSRWIDTRCGVLDENGTIVSLVYGSSIYISGETTAFQSAHNSDILALIDANGLNTTANELRKELDELREKINAAFDFIEMCHRKDAMDVLREALDKP